jgi:CheY-like chemotaxis protein
MSVSILVVDDEPDVADLFRQHFRREARQGTYVMHFAASGAEALDRLAGQAHAGCGPLGHQHRVRETTDHDHGARASIWTPLGERLSCNLPGWEPTQE